jgi:nucleoid DNA-binding protein
VNTLEDFMNKADLTEKLAIQAEIPKVRAAYYINIMVTAIQEALVEGQKVTISDFGTFTVSQRREFTGHNPKNGSEIRVPPRRIPVFRAGKGLKEALNDAE